MKTKIPVMLVVLLGAAGLSDAHDTWLRPERAAVEPGDEVALELTSGMAFPELEHGVAADRVDRAMGRVGEETFPIAVSGHAADALHCSARLARPGVATLWVELKPRAIDLTPPQVEHYLEEIGAAPRIRRQWADAPEPRTWHEIYTKHSKTFVRVGPPGGDLSWGVPAGMALEIVPEGDPTTLRAGDELSVRLVRPSGPVPDMQLGLVHEGDAVSAARRTDASGRVTFELDRPGWWMLRATRLERSPRDAGHWTSHFTTLTFQVLPRR